MGEVPNILPGEPPTLREQVMGFLGVGVGTKSVLTVTGC